jgi:hypothetical protein
MLARDRRSHQEKLGLADGLDCKQGGNQHALGSDQEDQRGHGCRQSHKCECRQEPCLLMFANSGQSVPFM